MEYWKQPHANEFDNINYMRNFFEKIVFTKTYLRGNRKSISLISINIIELITKSIPSEEISGPDVIPDKFYHKLKEEILPFLHTLSRIRGGNTSQLILCNQLNLKQKYDKTKKLQADIPHEHQ